LFRQTYGVSHDYNAEKLKCLFYYFNRSGNKIYNKLCCSSLLTRVFLVREETVKFFRVSLRSSPVWHASVNSMKEFKVMETGARMEESEGIQVDFANKCVYQLNKLKTPYLEIYVLTVHNFACFSGKLAVV
jgi:Poly (ADP-ribose) glycohydrolase (PARG)